MLQGKLGFRTLAGFLLAAAAILATGSSAVADTAIAGPPENLQASNEDGELVLTWDPPSVNAEAVEAYNVYKNGDVVDRTQMTETTLPSPAYGDIYWVTAVTEDMESAPSDRALAGPCVGIDPGYIPPVYIDPDCDPLLYHL